MSGAPRVRPVTADAIADAVARSRTSPRRRANHNIHASLDDPIQRFVNVFQPDSYVRPHRHERVRFELFVVLAGRVGLLLFDENGEVSDATPVEPGGAQIVEIDGWRTHTLVALAPDTVTFELKPGPYRPLAEEDFAGWAPLDGDPAAASLVARWRSLFPSSS